MKKTYKQAGLLGMTLMLASFATGPSPQDVAEGTQKVLKSSFRKVVETYLAAHKVLKTPRLNVPGLRGTAGNPGVA